MPAKPVLALLTISTALAVLILGGSGTSFSEFNPIGRAANGVAVQLVF